MRSELALTQFGRLDRSKVPIYPGGILGAHAAGYLGIGRRRERDGSNHGNEHQRESGSHSVSSCANPDTQMSGRTGGLALDVMAITNWRFFSNSGE
jgi:hypothetical protein